MTLYQRKPAFQPLPRPAARGLDAWSTAVSRFHAVGEPLPAWLVPVLALALLSSIARHMRGAPQTHQAFAS